MSANFGVKSTKCGPSSTEHGQISAKLGATSATFAPPGRRNICLGVCSHGEANNPNGRAKEPPSSGRVKSGPDMTPPLPMVLLTAPSRRKKSKAAGSRWSDSQLQLCNVDH